jgi:hypothetical protein
MKTKQTSSNVQGEGDYKAAKQYGDSVKSFVASGKAEKAIQSAKKISPAEQSELSKAEQIGLSKSKGEDPSSPKSPKRKA